MELQGQQQFGLGLAMLRAQDINTGTGVELHRGGSAPAWGLRARSSFFTDILAPLPPCQWSSYQLSHSCCWREDRKGGDINYVSLQLLLLFDCLWSNVRGPKAVPKAGGGGAVVTHCFPVWAAHQWSWGLGGDLVNSQIAPRAELTPPDLVTEVQS